MDKTDKQRKGQPGRQSEGRMDRQTDRQLNIEKYMHTCIQQDRQTDGWRR